MGIWVNTRLFLVVAAAFFTQGAFESANRFFDITKRGIDANSGTKSLECGAILSKLDVAAAHSGGGAKMERVQLQHALAIADGLRPVFVLEMHDGSLIERLGELRRLGDQRVQSRPALAAVTDLQKLLQFAIVFLLSDRNHMDQSASEASWRAPASSS